MPYPGILMNDKVLVAYFTKEGASEEYANIIADALTAKGLSVEKYNLANEIPDVTAYEAVVLGTGVKMSIVYRRWKKILKQKSLDSKQLFMFLSSGMAIEEPDGAIDKFLNPIIKKYGLKPKSLGSFPGKIPDKWAKLDEQKETMEPDKAKAWADEIASLIQSK